MPIKKWFLSRSLSKASGDSAKTGRLGESLAQWYLSRQKGYRILARNWYSGRDELDIICMDDTIMVFVEVKTRNINALVSGYHSVRYRKKKALLRACRSYLWSLHSRPQTFRFDVVDIGVSANQAPLIKHYSNVPLFPKGFR